MKKENYYKFIYGMSGLMFVGFIIRTIFDYIFSFGEDNFISIILFRCLVYLVPALLLFFIAPKVKRHYSKEE